MGGGARDNVTTIWEGTKAAWPICLGYFPAGLAFGVIAQKAGLSPMEIGLMSLVVFAGSSQFIAVSMLASGAGILPIVLTTFTVNLRNMLMSSVLAFQLRGVKKSWISLFAYGITDESFAVNLNAFRSRDWDWRRALMVNHVSNLSWVGSTILGGYGSKFVPQGSFGIDYALVAMLLCLLALQLRNGLDLLVGAISGVLAVLISLVLPGGACVIIASVIAATLGLVFRKKGRSSREAGS